MPSLKQSRAAELLLRRRSVLASLSEWARLCGYEPARHHRLVIEKLEAVERGEIRKLALFLPPGSAKSTYTSRLFPPWYLARKAGRCILAASYAHTLAEQFGRFGRNVVKQHKLTLDMDLCVDSQAAGEWSTTNNGIYFCAGVGAGIAGHRADLGLIDDPIGSQEDADSKVVRDKQWDWYCSDFIPRLKPGGAVILIQTRRHEEDLAGRLLASERGEWEVVSLPLIAKDNDPLGRAPGELLWPEWFNADILREARKNAQTFSALYQQDPTPEEGDFFQRSWLVDNLYNRDELPSNLRVYAASDHAVSLAQGADLTCLIPAGVDESGVLWVLPDVFWKKAKTDETVEAILEMCRRRRPITWWAGRDHISKSIGPFLEKRMSEEKVYAYIEEVTPAKDKSTRAQAIRGRMSMGKVRLPRFASWLPDAMHELLCFPHGMHDDFVDTLALLGLGLADMRRATTPQKPFLGQWPLPQDITLGWVKKNIKERELASKLRTRDF